jgi:hypothetical protein
MKNATFFALFFLFFNNANAQILRDNESKQLIISGLDKLYNYEFKEADILLQKVKAKYPNHPVTPLLSAVQLNWQYLDIAHMPKVAALHKQYLEKCVELTEPMIDDKDKFAEAVFFMLTSHGYIALSNTYSKEYLKAANEARKAYGYLKDGFKLMEKNPEFYATTGLYNFYIEQYPETHPIVKPAMIFFANGNKKLGLDYLDMASKKALFSKIEATYYLAHIYLKYENLPAKSLIYSTLLAEKYPNNLIFLMRNIEGLVLAGKYEEAIPKIEILRKNPDKVYQLSADVFDGIIAEKFKKNDKLAASFYWASFKFQRDEQYTKNYHAMAYAGIARIYNRMNDKAKAKEYYEKCLDIAEYKSLIQEAKNHP